MSRIADIAQIFRDEDGKWYVRTKSSNGQTIMTSEGYDDRQYAGQVAADTGLPIVLVEVKEDDNDGSTGATD